MNRRKENLHMLMAFTGNAIFGFSFLFSKLAMDVAEPFVLLAIRFAAAFALMTLLRLTGAMPCDLKGKDLKPLFLLGLLQPVIYFVCGAGARKRGRRRHPADLLAGLPVKPYF